MCVCQCKTAEDKGGQIQALSRMSVCAVHVWEATQLQGKKAKHDVSNPWGKEKMCTCVFARVREKERSIIRVGGV